MEIKNFLEIKLFFENLKINISDDDIEQLFKSLKKTESTQIDHDKQIWVYVDLNSDYIKKSDLIEEIDWDDLKNWLKGDFGKFFFIKIYHPSSNLFQDDILNFFKSLNDLQKIKGIYSYDFVGVKDVVVLNHNDGENLPFMRLICTVDAPEEKSIEKFGINIGDQILSPANNKFILFDPSKNHEAWNLTDHWWKFFIIDIKKEYITEC